MKSVFTLLVTILLVSCTPSVVFAVTGGGTGGSVEVTGGGTGGSTEVTGNGTGGSVEVTGGGTGGSTEVTGGGTGGDTEVTGNGTGSNTDVTGGGTGSPQAVSVDACMSGSFYDPAAPGEGINVEVLETQIVVYFYRADGAWFVLQGDDNGLDAYQPWGDSIVDVGNGVFVPVDNDTVVFGYDLLLDLETISASQPIPWCLRSDCSAEKELVRLTQPIPCAAAD